MRTRYEEMLMYPDEYRVMFELEEDYWWYRGVRVMLRDFLARNAPRDRAHTNILDAGCGTGANLRMLEAYGDAIGVDLSEEAIAFCHARGIPSNRAFVGTLTDLSFPNDHFDLAISFDVICNIPNDDAAFMEIARVIKPSGRFLVQLPAIQWLWSSHDVAVGHRRRYDAGTVREKISHAGMVVERLTYANILLLPFAALMRLMRRRALRNGRPVHSDLTRLPRLLNAPLGAVFTAEMRAVSRVSLPYGLSVIAVARKK